MSLRIGVDCSAITPGSSGGVENFAYGLLTALSRSGSIQEMIVEVPNGTSTQWRERMLAGPSLVIAESRRKPRGYFLVRRLIEKLIPSQSAASLRRTTSSSRDVDIDYFPFHRIPVHGKSPVLTAHDLRVMQPEFYEAKESSRLEGNLRQAKAVIASWPHPYASLSTQFPWVRSKLFCIPLPLLVDTTYVNEERPGSYSADSFGDDAVLLYPAATGEHKNHENLLRAMSLISEQRKVRLVCTGPLLLPFYERLKELVASLRVDGCVEFKGFVSQQELRALYARANAVVVPSLWEAASGPVFEAFACHVPVACSNVAPIRAQVDFAGGEVAFFDPLDPSDIAAAITRVVDQPSDYVAGSRRAADFLAGFTWERCAGDYLKVFDWVASGRGAPRPRLSYVPIEEERV